MTRIAFGGRGAAQRAKRFAAANPELKRAYHDVVSRLPYARGAALKALMRKLARLEKELGI